MSLTTFFEPFPYITQGRPQGEGEGSPPPETERNCCRKMVSFSRAVENDQGPGRLDRKLVKSQFSIEIFVGKFKNFHNKFQSPLVFGPNAKRFAARFLKLF